MGRSMGENLSPILNPVPKQEQEIPRELAPVTGEQLVNIMRSDRFLDMMDWAISYIERCPDAESGFTVLRDARNPEVVVCSEVHEGITWGIKDSQMNDFETAWDMTKKGYRPIFIFDFHTHPSGPLIIPSFDDIVSLERLKEGGEFSEMSEIPQNPIFAPVIGMIGHRRKNGLGILMFQRPGKDENMERLTDGESESLEQDLDAILERENVTQAEVLKV